MFLRPKVQRRNVTVSQNASLPWEREDGATKSIAYRGMKMGRPPKVSVDNDAKLPRHDQLVSLRRGQSTKQSFARSGLISRVVRTSVNT